eukprot:GHVN01067414.1.p1 GENE.GHVN01067414.1~~GHVN01067414.1.p1  ORF type:complete len:1674 (+),score=189.89 GHVN01067414.1:308-5329(+)
MENSVWGPAPPSTRYCSSTISTTPGSSRDRQNTGTEVCLERISQKHQLVDLLISDELENISMPSSPRKMRGDTTTGAEKMLKSDLSNFNIQTCTSTQSNDTRQFSLVNTSLKKEEPENQIREGECFLGLPQSYDVRSLIFKSTRAHRLRGGREKRKTTRRSSRPSRRDYCRGGDSRRSDAGSSRSSSQDGSGSGSGNDSSPELRDLPWGADQNGNISCWRGDEYVGRLCPNWWRSKERLYPSETSRECGKSSDSEPDSESSSLRRDPEALVLDSGEVLPFWTEEDERLYCRSAHIKNPLLQEMLRGKLDMCSDLDVEIPLSVLFDTHKAKTTEELAIKRASLWSRSHEDGRFGSDDSREADASSNNPTLSRRVQKLNSSQRLRSVAQDTISSLQRFLASRSTMTPNLLDLLKSLERGIRESEKFQYALYFEELQAAQGLMDENDRLNLPSRLDDRPVRRSRSLGHSVGLSQLGAPSLANRDTSGFEEESLAMGRVPRKTKKVVEAVNEQTQKLFQVVKSLTPASWHPYVFYLMCRRPELGDYGIVSTHVTRLAAQEWEELQKRGDLIGKFCQDIHDYVQEHPVGNIAENKLYKQKLVLHVRTPFAEQRSIALQAALDDGWVKKPVMGDEIKSDLDGLEAPGGNRSEKDSLEEDGSLAAYESPVEGASNSQTYTSRGRRRGRPPTLRGGRGASVGVGTRGNGEDGPRRGGRLRGVDRRKRVKDYGMDSDEDSLRLGIRHERSKRTCVGSRGPNSLRPEDEDFSPKAGRKKDVDGDADENMDVELSPGDGGKTVDGLRRRGHRDQEEDDSSPRGRSPKTDPSVIETDGFPPVVCGCIPMRESLGWKRSTQPIRYSQEDATKKRRSRRKRLHAVTEKEVEIHEFTTKSAWPALQQIPEKFVPGLQVQGAYRTGSDVFAWWNAVITEVSASDITMQLELGGDKHVEIMCKRTSFVAPAVPISGSRQGRWRLRPPPVQSVQLDENPRFSETGEVIQYSASDLYTGAVVCCRMLESPYQMQDAVVQSIERVPDGEDIVSVDLHYFADGSTLPTSPKFIAYKMLYDLHPQISTSAHHDGDMDDWVWTVPSYRDGFRPSTDLTIMNQSIFDAENPNVKIRSLYLIPYEINVAKECFVTFLRQLNPPFGEYMQTAASREVSRISNAINSTSGTLPYPLSVGVADSPLAASAATMALGGSAMLLTTSMADKSDSMPANGSLPTLSLGSTEAAQHTVSLHSTRSQTDGPTTHDYVSLTGPQPQERAEESNIERRVDSPRLPRSDIYVKERLPPYGSVFQLLPPMMNCRREFEKHMAEMSRSRSAGDRHQVQGPRPALTHTAPQHRTSEKERAGGEAERGSGTPVAWSRSAPGSLVEVNPATVNGIKNESPSSITILLQSDSSNPSGSPVGVGRVAEMRTGGLVSPKYEIDPTALGSPTTPVYSTHVSPHHSAGQEGTHFLPTFPSTSPPERGQGNQASPYPVPSSGGSVEVNRGVSDSSGSSVALMPIGEFVESESGACGLASGGDGSTGALAVAGRPTLPRFNLTDSKGAVVNNQQNQSWPGAMVSGDSNLTVATSLHSLTLPAGHSMGAVSANGHQSHSYQPKRRGRPRKYPSLTRTSAMFAAEAQSHPPVVKQRGRPRKYNRGISLAAGVAMRNHSDFGQNGDGVNGRDYHSAPAEGSTDV